MREVVLVFAGHRLVGEAPQPIAASPRLRNLPERDYYNWEPGAYFGIYRPDSFWFE